MPRSKTFEPAAAMGQVVDLFWRSGFSNTSFDRLVSRTGASRYGLYATFGGKNQLLLAAMDRYTHDVVDPLMAPLEDPDASIPQIRMFLERVLRMVEKGDQGCLMCNVALEAGRTRAVVARRIRAHFARQHALVKRALGNARAARLLPPSRDIDEYAHFLVAVPAGSCLMARAGMPAPMPTILIRTALAALKEAM